MIARLLSNIIIGLRPLFGPAQCRYALGCTQFAVMQLQEEPLMRALWHITKRVLSCNPIAQFIAKKRTVALFLLAFAPSISAQFSGISITFVEADPQIIRTSSALENIMRKITDLLKVTPNGASIVRHNGGYTIIQFIMEKAYIALTVLDKENLVRLDIVTTANRSVKAQQLARHVEKLLAAQYSQFN